MTRTDDRLEPAADPSAISGLALRRRAEEIAREKTPEFPEDLAAQSPEQARQALHELRVHQIELEMQNEELRRAQAELGAARARYFDLYDLAPVGYVTISEKGLIMEANLTAATLLGVARRELVRQPMSRFILQADHDPYYRFRKQLFETGIPQAEELRMVKPDGTKFWAKLEATAALDPAAISGLAAGGEPVWRLVLSDVTVRKQTDADKTQLDKLKSQLQKADSLGRMAGAVAHHFNNQLQVVLGSLELAQGRLPADEGKLAELLSDATQAARRASEVGSQMLAYLGHTPDRFTPLDLSDLCRRSLPMLTAALPRNVALEPDLPLPGPVVSANANQIQQVLTNLVTNAFEAVGDVHCAIQLKVGTVAAAEIPASPRFPIDSQIRGSDYACLQVADRGCGISAKDIDNIFDPFFSSKFTGRGMGLAVVLGIARAHEAIITVQSEPGGGSIFRIHLPRSAEKVPRLPQEQGRPETGDRTPAIPKAGAVLLAEDDRAVRELTAMMLASLGFGVIQAKDGVEAVEMFGQRQAEICCVVCDLSMPRLGGWETLAALRQLAPGIPVVLASGRSEGDAMAGDHPQLPQAFLSKPYGLGELRDVMRRALANKRD